MTAVRDRISKVDKILSGHSPMKEGRWDVEVVALLVRKSLEHIAFGSLIAHRERYAEAHADFAAHWNAKRLLWKLEQIHPDYYPRPAAFPIVETTDRIKHMQDVRDDFLTKEDFITLYDVCSRIIHTHNPYAEGPWEIDTIRPLADWTSRIKRLLDLHYIRLSSVPGVWLTQMVHPQDGKVHVFQCEPI